MPANPVYQLKITLNGSKPPIWRRVLVDRATTFRDLHRIIQLTMGWQSVHLHHFQTSDGTLIGDPVEDFDDMMNYVDEANLPIEAVLQREKQKLRYEYDFGDGWEHDVVLEKILPGDNGQALPTCIKAVRRCPPENVGGLYGFYDFLHAMKDVTHPQHKLVREWMGIDLFDPDLVDLDQINEDLANREQIFGPALLDSGADLEGLDALQIDALLQDPRNCPEVFSQEPDWETASREVQAAPIIRVLVALVHELQGKGVRLTPKGNLPLKTVMAVIENAGEDFQTHHVRAGMGRVRSEEDVLPVHLLRILAEIVGFTRKEKGRLLLKKRIDARAHKSEWLGLYADLFRVLMQEFNWGWMDHYPGLEDIQVVGPYAIWLLARYGDQWRPFGFYRDKMLNAFPGLMEMVEPLPYVSTEQQLDWALKSRVIELYEFLGLLEVDQKDPPHLQEKEEQQLRRTGLFESLFRP